MLPRLVSHTYIVNLSLPSPLRLPGEKLEAGSWTAKLGKVGTCLPHSLVSIRP